MPDYVKSPALVVQSFRWKESSKITHLYSRQHGYIKLVAKGALRPKSDFRGALESMNLVEVLYQQRGNKPLQNLNSIAVINPYINIRDDLRKTAIAFSILELLRKLLGIHEPLEAFFDYTVELFEQLSASQLEHPYPYLWHFLFRLSDVLGFGWNLEQCIQCQKTPEKFPLSFNIREGSISCQQCVPTQHEAQLSMAQWELLRRFLTEEILDPFLQKPATTPLLETKLSGVLLRHLAYHTESRIELKSLKWYV